MDMTNPPRFTRPMVTLSVDPNNGWQACRKLTGYVAQHKVTGPHAWRVETDWSIIGRTMPSYIHGPWDQVSATRFAQSMGNGDRSKAVACEPYYYCEAWGRVATAAVHEYEAVKDWSVRPAGAVVLGSDSVVE